MKLIVFAIILLVLTLLGWGVSGPFRTVDAIDQAVQTHDMELLNRNVDFPLLRQNLKAQMGRVINQKMDEEGQRNPFVHMLGAAVATLLSDSLVDALVTPEGIGRLLAGKGVEDALGDADPAPGPPAPQGQSQAAKPAPDAQRSTHWQFRSPSEFVLKVQRGDKLTSFVLGRYGLGWKLNNIILPVE